MLKVLIIDDEESLRHSLSLHLSELGYVVETAENPNDCACVKMNSCQSGGLCADVIVVDHCMPGMTGLEYLSGRKGRRCQGQNQKLAIMSGFLTDDDVRLAEELGCKVFVKPFSLSEIEQWLDTIVQSR